MARGINRLSDKEVKNLKAGSYADGGGLMLFVSKTGARRWAYIWNRDGKRREKGLGSVLKVPLKEARKLASILREKVGAGIDPIEEERIEKEQALQAQKQLIKFGDFADEWFEREKAPSLSNEKHKDQWRMTLRVYCAPMRDKPISQITTQDILEVLSPIWHQKMETASRLRGRIEKIIDAASVQGNFPNILNPARWDGHLSKHLSQPKKLQKGHHAALEWQELPEFLSKLRERSAVAGRLLEFIILTCLRASEAAKLTWAEYDPEKKVIIIPAARMKARVEHIVPLSDRAIELIEQMRAFSDEEPSSLVFEGNRKQKPFSLTSLEKVRERFGYESITTHGFRSTFRDWAFEYAEADREIAEACLAHSIGNAVEKAYRRGRALERRRIIMDKWADFCTQNNTCNVISFGGQKCHV